MTGSSRQLWIVWSARGTEARQDYGLLYLTEFWAVSFPALHVALPLKFCLKNLQAHVMSYVPIKGSQIQWVSYVASGILAVMLKVSLLWLFLSIVDLTLVCIDFTSKNVRLSASY